MSIERVWQPPCGCPADPCDQLVLYNSLVDRKVAFVPQAGPQSRQIVWYTCGPTVYDSAHVGHARNYLSFDIVRRVLEDYFGYNCLYIMNVTDVDDKIILRARRNHLLSSYRDAARDPAQVYADASAALAAAVDKQRGKVAEAEAALAEAAADSGSVAEKRREELATNLAQEQMLLGKQLSAAAALEAAGAAAAIERQLEIAGDALAEALDKQLGATVTDPAIFRAHAAKYEGEFLEDLAALGCRLPTVLTRVSEYIPEIVQYVEQIVANGMGYEANGSVYFDTQAFRAGGHTYGKLNPWAVGAAALAGEAADPSGEKRHPCDFALWKAAKPGEPFWDSPWGKGRPGWHIECSAMASAVAGDKLDIHTGGEDLRFPHHDNELAQAEAYYHACGCQQWVNYFLHSGHLGIEGLKMSKSLKNFITIRQALESFSPRQLRLMFALQPWEKKMNYGEQAKEEMRAKEALLKNFFANVEVALRTQKVAVTSQRWEEEERQLQRELDGAQRRVHEALCDNINTQAAMGALCDLVKAANIYLAARQDAAGPQPQPFLLRAAAAFITRILSVFGLAPAPGDFLGFADPAVAANDDAMHAVLDGLCAFRDAVRALAKSKAPASEVAAACQGAPSEEAQQAGASGRPKDMLAAFAAFQQEIAGLAAAGAPPGEVLAACDRVRDDTLVDLGIRLEDKPDGSSVWKPEDPAVLRQEQEERRRAAAEARGKKLRGQLDNKRKELDKFEKLAALPSIPEALADKYRFDAAGEPSHDKEGAALEGKGLDKARKEVEKQKKALDKALKEVEKQKKVRAPLEKKLAEDPAFLQALAADIAALAAELAALGVAENGSA
ncbi:Cysteinyl-tRNA synthetase isoform C [Chlorella sorokiniana]|uniref:cysteine--tRNA ligase n=1 Tax=Chlorella sorokiniana TaxID=3076 RepID=A0A2P6TI72_CHLSO|nr:Cysteinyl-tRNA synthetase isoform C [Chlorella sorokiniana]|eukprot:PRW33977.1 Cysteinyl-tRNA synthetase isoform C [Chlorella sorokiniana]